MLDLIVVPMVAALVILLLHAYLGLHVIRREVIFVDLAFAQIAALGATVAMLVPPEWLAPLQIFGAEAPEYIFAFATTVLGALIFSFTRLEDSPVPQEAIIGITYVVASAAVILLAGLTAEGAEHIKETLTGTLIWVTWPTVGKMALPYALLAVFYWVFRKPILAVTFEPETVERPRLWDFVFYVTFGLVITFSVPIAGVLMVFSTLVIPAVIAFLYTAHFGWALVWAWISGTVAIVGGILVSFWLDIATGPALVCAFGLTLILAAALRPLAGRRPREEIKTRILEEGEAAPSTPSAGV